MNSTRRNFLKKTCAAGSCFCGFTSLASGSTSPSVGAGKHDSNQLLMQEWISALMLSLDEQTNEELSRQILKKCARTHYDQLNMDEVLQAYVGNLKKFILFLNSNWNWVINFDEQKEIIYADENKEVCVCPLVNQEKGVKSAILCYCSEGFAELMFSRVTGKPVEARIISSIHQGHDRCKYEVKLN
jgi:predicted hydrocarbon binding protein